jgi:hypothetical protein
MQLLDFSGGISNRVSKHLLAANEAIICSNIDSVSGSIVPVNSDSPVSITSYPFFTKFKGKWVSVENQTNFVEYRDKLYYTTPTNLMVNDGDSTLSIGIAQPEDFITPTSGLSTWELVDTIESLDIVYLHYGVLPIGSGTLSFTVKGLTTTGSFNVSFHGVAGEAGYITLSDVMSITSIEMTIGSNTSNISFKVSRSDDPTTIDTVDLDTMYLLDYDTVLAGPQIPTRYNYTTLLKNKFILVNKRNYDSVYVSYDSVELSYSGEGWFGTILITNTSSTHNIEAYRYIPEEFGYMLVSVLLPSKGVLDYDDKIAEYTVPLGGEVLSNRYYVATYVREVDGIAEYSSGSNLPYTQDFLLSYKSQVYWDPVVALVASDDPKVNKIYLYRMGGDISNFTLVGTYSNETQVISDDLADMDIATNPILTRSSLEAPTGGLINLIYYKGMLMGSKGDTLYYSEIIEFDNWPTDHYISFEEAIVGLYPIRAGLLVFTTNLIYLIVGDDHLSFTKLMVSQEFGCSNGATIREVNNMVVWLSNSGVCSTVDGVNVELLSFPKCGDFAKFKKLNGLTEAITASVLNHNYYLFYVEGVVVFDFQINPKVYTMSKAYSYAKSLDNALYGYKDGYIYQLLSGQSPEEYIWKSGRLTEGSITQLKTYKNLYISYLGSCKVIAYIDGEVFADVDLNSTSVTTTEIKLRQGSKGYYLELEVSGTAEIYEIEYKVEGRQNGR